MQQKISFRYNRAITKNNSRKGGRHRPGLVPTAGQDTNYGGQTSHNLLYSKGGRRMSVPQSKSDGADVPGEPGADTRPRVSGRRMSSEASREYAKGFKTLMKECRLPSVYALLIHSDSDYARSTLKRWLSGEARIPVEGARRLIEALLAYAARLSASPLLQELDNLVSVESHEPSDERLRAELRARRVPVSRTLAALRAVSLLPPEANTP